MCVIHSLQSFLRVRAQSQEAMSNALLEDAQVVFTTLSSSALGKPYRECRCSYSFMAVA